VAAQKPSVSEVIVEFNKLYAIGFAQGEFIGAAGIEVIYDGVNATAWRGNSIAKDGTLTDDDEDISRMQSIRSAQLRWKGHDGGHKRNQWRAGADGRDGAPNVRISSSLSRDLKCHCLGTSTAMIAEWDVGVLEAVLRERGGSGR
jgi:hypothetical protein